MAFRVDSLADLPTKFREQAAGLIMAQRTRSKYGNHKTTVNGIKFDSIKEAERYQVLLDAQRKGYIYDLRLQHDFTLVEAYTTCTGQRMRALKYRADFTYYLSDGFYAVPVDGDVEQVVKWYQEMQKPGINPLVVEDVKSSGTRTKEYMMKKKLMADKGYIILEV